jgi:hypothetical protein
MGAVAPRTDPPRGHWPTAPCLWFARHATPVVPEGSPLLRAVVPLQGGPRLGAALVVQLAAREVERQRLIEAASAFNDRYALRGVSATIVTLVALRVPWRRIPDLTRQEDFAKYCSASVYPKLGVRSSEDVIALVMDFVCL